MTPPLRARDPVGPPAGSIGLVATVAARPDLWWSAVGALRRMAAPGWWQRAPYLPVPARDLWAFRMVTAYGDPDATPVAADVVSYLEWCRSTSPRRRSVLVGAGSRLAGAVFHPDRHAG